MYEIFFNWCGDMSKNTVKNGKQKNRVGGSKLGIICSRIRKTQNLLHPAFLLSDAGNPPSVCLRQIKNKLT